MLRVQPQAGLWDLSGQNLTIDDCCQYAKALQHGGAASNVEILDLQRSGIGLAGFQYFADAFASPDCLVSELLLQENRAEISSLEMIQVLMKVLETNNNLRHIRIDENPSTQSAIEEMLIVLRLNSSMCQPLKQIFLSALELRNVVDSSRKDHLMKVLSSLNLSGIDFNTSNAAISISLVMQCVSPLLNPFLHTLDLSGTNVGDRATENLQCLLRESRALRNLLLDQNGISIHGLQNLAPGIADSQSLETLSLRDNKLSDDAIRSLVSALQKNDTLLVCHVSGNAVSQQSLDLLNRGLLLNAQPLQLKRYLLRAQENDPQLTEICMQEVARTLEPGQSLKLSANFLALPLRMQNTYVTTLNLSNTEVDFPSVSTLSQMLLMNRTLRSLSLANNGISTEGALCLADALTVNNTLKELNLANNVIQEDGGLAFVSILDSNDSLVLVNLQLNNISQPVLDRVDWLTLQNRQPIALKRTLSLIQNDSSALKIIDFSQFDGAQYHSDDTLLLLKTVLLGTTAQYITELNFRGNQIGDSGAIHIAEIIQEGTSLQSVRLGHNGIGSRGGVAIAHSLLRNHSIRVLDLEHNCLAQEAGEAFLAMLLENHVLEGLVLIGNNRIPASVMEQINRSVQLNTQPVVLKSLLPKLLARDENLTRLDLAYPNGAPSNRYFDDTATEILSQTLCLLDASTSGIRSIQMSHNLIEVRGARALAEVIRMNFVALCILDLSNNAIGDDGLTSISQGLRFNTTLQSLNIEYNDIGDVGAATLVRTLRETNDTITELFIEDGNVMISPFMFQELEQEISLNRQPLTLKHTLPFLLANSPLDRTIAGAQFTNTEDTISTHISFSAGNSDQTHTTIERSTLKNVCTEKTRNILEPHSVNEKHRLTRYNDDSCRAIAIALRTNNTVTHLDLSHNKIASDGVIFLSEMLRDNHTLRHIDLSYNIIDDCGLNALVKVINSLPHSTLRTINIKENCNVTYSAIYDLGIALFLNHLHPHLKQYVLLALGVTIEESSDEESEASPKVPLKTQHLESIITDCYDFRHEDHISLKIDDQALVIICQLAILTSNVSGTKSCLPVMRELLLNGNDISDKGMQEIARMLLGAHTLTVLDVRDNPRITATGIRAISTTLRVNHTLKTFLYDRAKIQYKPEGDDPNEVIEASLHVNIQYMSTEERYRIAKDRLIMSTKQDVGLGDSSLMIPSSSEDQPPVQANAPCRKSGFDGPFRSQDTVISQEKSNDGQEAYVTLCNECADGVFHCTLKNLLASLVS